MPVNQPNLAQKREYFKNSFGFTLAEVLITLGIIGIVAAMTIPTIMKNTQDAEFKSAYKKAFSDASNIWQSMRVNNEIATCSGNYDSNCADANFLTFKNYMKVSTSCGSSAVTDFVGQCWDMTGEVFAEKTNPPGIPTKGNNGGAAVGFVDTSGRSWIMLLGIWWWADQLMVDTNGFKPPNKLGKDRWVFWLTSSSSNAYSDWSSDGVYKYLHPSPDASSIMPYCGNPPCYGTSWLYN